MDEKKEVKVVHQITDAVNSFSFDSDLFCQTMGCEHKTLQQSFMRDIIVPFIKYAASSEYRTDGRNEDTHRMAEVLNKALESFEGGLAYI